MDNNTDDNSNINLVYISTGLNTGGAEIVLFQLISKLPPNYKINVISLSSIGEIGERIRNSGIHVYALNLNSSFPNPFKLLKLYRLLKSIKPDVVNTWLYHANMLGGVIARFAGIKNIIWSIHHSDVDSCNTRYKTRYIIKITSYLSYWIPSQILFVSHKSMNVHETIGYNHKIFNIIPNGFDTSQFYPVKEAYASVRKELGLKNDVILVGLIARFDPIKNHKGFLEAAYHLIQMLPNVHFLLVGKNIEWSNKELLTWIEDFGLNDKVHLLGLRNDIARLTSALDIATLTSWSEAFPTIVGEAMACSVPCVVTDVGDASYMVGSSGKVIRIGDMKAFAEACFHLLSLSSLERKNIGFSARQRVNEKFNLNLIILEYDSLYKKSISAIKTKLHI